MVTEKDGKATIQEIGFGPGGGHTVSAALLGAAGDVGAATMFGYNLEPDQYYSADNISVSGGNNSSGDSDSSAAASASSSSTGDTIINPPSLPQPPGGQPPGGGGGGQGGGGKKKGNNGKGNGCDPQPPGNPKPNDTGDCD